MVVQDQTGTQPAKELKDLHFEPVLNVKEQVNLSYEGPEFYKCSVEPGLGLLGICCGTKFSRKFICVDMSTKEMIFETGVTATQQSHWIAIKGRKYLSLRTKDNVISMFEIDEETKSFKKDEVLEINLPESDKAGYTQFDGEFENIFIL